MKTTKGIHCYELPMYSSIYNVMLVRDDGLCMRLEQVREDQIQARRSKPMQAKGEAPLNGEPMVFALTYARNEKRMGEIMPMIDFDPIPDGVYDIKVAYAPPVKIF